MQTFDDKDYCDNSKRYLNADIDLLNFEIIIEYNSEKINQVTISYKQNDYDVVTLYQVK